MRALEGHVGRALIPLAGAPGRPRTPDARFPAEMREIETGLRSCGTTACHGAAAQPREMAQRLAPYMDVLRRAGSRLASARTSPEERNALMREIDTAGGEVSLQLQRMSAALLGRVAALQERSEHVYERAWRLIAGAIVVIVPLAILIAYLVSRQLVLAQQMEAQRVALEVLVADRTAKLEQAHASLVRSEKLASLGVLAAGVAHELNNPLTSVLMNVSLLVEDLDDRPDLRRELERVKEDVRRCQRIIDDLRDFSRGHELEMRRCDLNGLVTDVLAPIARQLDVHKLTLSSKLSPHVPAVCCDRDRIRQVLVNVLVNAIQATPQGGRLEVRTEPCDGAVAITVSDNGAGIAPETRSRIFDPFFTTKPEGTGLGLSIVHRIMEEHRGRIEVRSLTAAEAATSHGGAPGTAVRLLLPVSA